MYIFSTFVIVCIIQISIRIFIAFMLSDYCYEHLNIFMKFAQFATSPTIQFVPPPPPPQIKNCKALFSISLGTTCMSQETLKTMFMQKKKEMGWGGANKVHYGRCRNGEHKLYYCIINFLPSLPGISFTAYRSCFLKLRSILSVRIFLSSQWSNH